MTFELRSVDRAEAEAYLRCCSLAFGSVLSEERMARGLARFDPDFALAVFDQGRMVATAGVDPMEMTLPGGPGQRLPVVAVPGVTSVGVLPTHRRQGLLTRLMERQLGDLRRRGFPVAVLLASEATIYGRFGYGLAQRSQALVVDRSRAAFRPDADAQAAAGRVRLVEPDEAAKLLPLLHDQGRRQRPGELSRAPRWWRWHLADPEGERDGAGPRLYVVHESDRGEADGWVSYRVRSRWSHGMASFHADVNDLVATTDVARAALWRLVLNLDLVAEVSAPSRPLDEALPWMLADPRQVRTTQVDDHLWLRILDIPAALAARGYSASERLVLEITAAGPTLGGRFILESGPTAGSCHVADPRENAHLVLGLADLGALYLGGVAPSVLAGAGRIKELRPGALAAADRVFASPVAPYCSLHF